MKYCLISILSLFMLACGKEQNSLITMQYNQTQCNDKWGNASETTPAVVIDYYKQNHNIELQEVIIYIKDSTASVCLACTCTSGKIIEAKVPEKNKPVMETTGFKVK